MPADTPDLDAAVKACQRFLEASDSNRKFPDTPMFYVGWVLAVSDLEDALPVVLDAMARLQTREALRDESTVPTPTPEQAAELARLDKVLSEATDADPLDAAARELIAAREKAIPGEWFAVRTNWRNEPVPHDIYIRGDQYENGDEDQEDGEPRFVSTSVCIVPGNPSSEPLTSGTAAFIVAAANHAADIARECQRRGERIGVLEKAHREQEQERTAMQRLISEQRNEIAVLNLVRIEARELVGEADATGVIPQANLEALRALLWRADIRKGR